MWIRFKFRSAVSFDVVDIGDRTAISVRELKSKIVAQKNLKLCNDFDLVFSDHLSGKEYDDENYQIRSNSSVIIKRVPAGSVPPPLPIDSVVVMKKSEFLHEKDGEMDDFDDFGIDLCPVPEKGLPYSDLESKRKNISDTEKANIVGSRLGGQQLQANGLIQVIPKGSDQSGTEGKLPPEKMEPNIQTHVKLGKRAIDPYDLAEKNATLPPELRCPICTKYMKEAVMIPCCQQSFCEICIRRVLSQKFKCPKCSSDKFKGEHLLPNLSLREAMKHFLKIQEQLSLPETALRRYVPDEESCIQAKDLFSAPTNRRLGESFRESIIKINVHHADSPGKTGYPPGLDESQGENYPLSLHQNHVQEKGEDRNVSAAARYKKADHTCYMCDAPDHFVRDCPFANGPHPLLQTGNSMYAVGVRPTFATPYWNSTAFGHMRPFTNISANHGMMFYNASTFPASPIGVSPYMASMYGHIPAHCGIPRMSGMAPLPGNRTENPLTLEDFLETQGIRISGNHSKEYMPRRKPSDDDDNDIQTDSHNLPKSTKEYLLHGKRENSGSYSGDKHTRRSRGNDLHAEHYDCSAHSLHDRHGKNFLSLTGGTRDRKAYHAERSNHGAENMSKSSDRYVDERHYQRYHKITRNLDERRRKFGSKSKWNEHHGKKDKKNSGDQRKRMGEGDRCRSSKHERDGTECSQYKLFCSSKLVRRDDDYKEDSQRKWKRVC